MASVQTNIRLPTDIKDWLQSKAKEDGRTKGEVLARIIRPLMMKNSQDAELEDEVRKDLKKRRADIINRFPDYIGDTHKQQALIPPIDKNEGFDGFWEVYPKKKAKADALKAWKKNECWKIKGNIIADVICRVRNDPSWIDKNYVPNGATYLNGKRWEDEIIQQDNRPKFEQQGDALREQLFGKKGETYEH